MIQLNWRKKLKVCGRKNKQQHVSMNLRKRN